jgi:hypothetical protein
VMVTTAQYIAMGMLSNESKPSLLPPSTRYINLSGRNPTSTPPKKEEARTLATDVRAKVHGKKSLTSP